MAERQQCVKDLYIRNFRFILDEASVDPLLLVNDINNVASSVARHLDGYAGPIDDGEFQSWASEIIAPAVMRMAAFYRIKKSSENSVRKGIWSVFKNCKNLGCDADTVNEVAQRVWVWTLENLDDLCAPNETAKVSTRLYQKAFWAARSEKTRRVRDRDDFATIDDLDKMGRDEKGKLFIEPPDALAEAA